MQFFIQSRRKTFDKKFRHKIIFPLIIACITSIMNMTVDVSTRNEMLRKQSIRG
jgi:hypothetical protein